MTPAPFFKKHYDLWQKLLAKTIPTYLKNWTDCTASDMQNRLSKFSNICYMRKRLIQWIINYPQNQDLSKKIRPNCLKVSFEIYSVGLNGKVFLCYIHLGNRNLLRKENKCELFWKNILEIVIISWCFKMVPVI